MGTDRLGVCLCQGQHPVRLRTSVPETRDGDTFAFILQLSLPLLSVQRRSRANLLLECVTLHEKGRCQQGIEYRVNKVFLNFHETSKTNVRVNEEEIRAITVLR